MPNSLTLFVTVSLALLLVLQLALKLPVIRHFRRPLPPLIENADCALALVVLCLRGGDPFLKNSLRLLLEQDYPRYGVRIVVDSPQDEAHGILREVLGESPPPHVEVLNLTQRHLSCSAKVSGLLQATQRLPEGTGLVAVMDGDAVPHRSWLRELATPIVRDGVAVSTGIRWYAPNRSTVGSLCRFWWNASAMPIVMRLRIAWGGSMAVRGDVIQNDELRSRLKQAFSEDSTISQYAIDHGERIEFPPTLVIVNREDIGILDFYRFDVRQLLIGRVGCRSWPWLFLHSLVSCLAMTYPLWRLCGLPVGGIADVSFVGYCLAIWGGELAQAAAIRKVLETRNERITCWNELGRWGDSSLAMLILPYLHLAAILCAATLRRVCWRGLWYRIGGQLPVQIERDESA